MSDGRREDLAGRSVLIAGASGGIGAAIARRLHAAGANLTLVARDLDRLRAVGVPARLQPLDLRDPEQARRAVEVAHDHAGRLDIVVNAVGVVAFGSVSELSVDAMEELFLTNTFVPIFLAKAALEVMEERGAIVNISGVIAERNLPGMAAYGASKAAVRSFDEALAREARRKKIRVIDARPPHTATALSEHPIEGTAPRMPQGLAADVVAAVICEALADGATALPSTSFEAGR
jgi:cyclic-di-GMP-binding biofilm dispersal mediator protein